MRDVTETSTVICRRITISTHTPHAGRDDGVPYSSLNSAAISTHTPHAGRDKSGTVEIAGDTGFLLTRPMRDVTQDVLGVSSHFGISTHTPHAGRDFGEVRTVTIDGISTHTPHAGRDGLMDL